MDNVTHTLTGLMLARCGLDAWARRDPKTRSGSPAAGKQLRGKAAAVKAPPATEGFAAKYGVPIMIMLAANAPDMDIVGGLKGALTYLEFHRGYAHSLACAPLVALVPLLLMRWLARVRISRGAYLACLIAVLSHLLLDWTNVYGIRMLLPFSSAWLRLDITDIVDPWILLILIGALAAPALSGMVNSEIASRKVAPPVRGWAWVALIAILFYEGGRWVLHDQAVTTLQSRLYGANWTARRASAIPSRFNPWAWRGIVEGGGFVDEFPMNLWGEFNADSGRLNYTTMNSPDVRAALQTDAFRVFASFDQVPFWRLSPVPEGVKVELIDLRFGTVEQPGFEAIATVDPKERVLESSFTLGRPR
jgi:inner membrane protein